MKRFSRLLSSITIVSGLAAALSGCWKSASPDRPPIASSTPSISRANSFPTPMRTSSNMSNIDDKPLTSGGFFGNVPASFERPSDDVGNRLLKEYGAIFIARGGAIPPSTVIFRDESAVSAFQGSLSKASENISGVSIELQSAAIEALKKAASDAKSSGKSITPRGGDAARRNYNGTVDLWKSRVDPGLAHWSDKGRITSADAARIKALSPFEQVPEIFKLEAQGIFSPRTCQNPSFTQSHRRERRSIFHARTGRDRTRRSGSSINTGKVWLVSNCSIRPSSFYFLGVPESDCPAWD